MWIVELALRRPHTFIVMAIAIAIFGVLALVRMPIDIFPPINEPIVSCIWTYQGMSPYWMENLVTTITEKSLTSTVNGIDHMDSMSLNGMSIIKVYLHQGTPIGEAVAMVTSVGSAIRRQLPRGISPPFVTESSATDVPVLQLVLKSDKLSEAELFDIANNVVRNQLATIQGATIPFPYGGKYRQVTIDLNPDSLTAFQLSPSDIVSAVDAQNVINPTGTMKSGATEYVVVLNDIAATIKELERMPVKVVNGSVVYLRDVGWVHDGSQPQLNIVNLNGHRAVLFNVLKTGNASTLDVVNRAKQALPRLRSIVPPECQIEILSDQSTFVKECVSEVAREAATAAGLTALMILALLGSWRSTLIVATSIPLALLTALIALNISGQTINSMTLGGLALAVGMLVDDATVEIENLHRNLGLSKEITQAILDGANQVALPALVSTMSICIVFVPVFFLMEPSRSLFVPLGMSVVFAMMASYGLSRTIVPLMCKYLIGKEEQLHKQAKEQGSAGRTDDGIKSIFVRIHQTIDGAFDAARDRYHETLAWVLDHQMQTACLFICFYAVSFCLLPFVGREYFPTIDGGQLRLHIVAPAGTRVEKTEGIFKDVEREIRKALPAGDIESVVQNIGLPVSGINYAYSDSQTVGESDGEMLITLSDHRKRSTQFYQQQVRDLVHSKFPEYRFYFQPADIVTQILNAGLPAPIAVRILGMNREYVYNLLKQVKHEVSLVPGAVDVCIHQLVDAPAVQWDVDRTRAAQLSLNQTDSSSSMNISLTSSFQTKPNFWLNRSTGITYNLATQTPQRMFGAMEQVATLPVTAANSNETSKPAEMLLNLAQHDRGKTPVVANHFDVMPIFEAYASAYGRDLGSVSDDIQKIVNRYKAKLHRGNFMFIGGQVLAMKLAFIALIAGLAFAIMLVYLLLVVNYQSWTDPLIILMAVPGAMSGISWSLFITHTALSIPALMGTIMTVGVASANSILMVTFAREQLEEVGDAKQAALNAGYERFRPVIMTATAMIIGMIPMAIGGGEGSQNAPIGRAVIGGLIVATFSTLLFVPLFFASLRSRMAKKVISQEASS